MWSGKRVQKYIISRWKRRLSHRKSVTENRWQDAAARITRTRWWNVMRTSVRAWGWKAIRELDTMMRSKVASVRVAQTVANGISLTNQQRMNEVRLCIWGGHSPAPNATTNPKPQKPWKDTWKRIRPDRDPDPFRLPWIRMSDWWWENSSQTINVTWSYHLATHS